MWSITVLTAAGMGIINFVTIFAMEFLVELKFGWLQWVVDRDGIALGILTLVGTCVGFGTCCTLLIFFFAPDAGGSGAPENKGWLNGSKMKGYFTVRNLFGRGIATIIANATGYPVGREGPTVTMGSNLAVLITQALAKPYMRQWVHMHTTVQALVVDEEQLAHAKRIAGAVGGACGMAMIFDAPIGGIMYMLEDITTVMWPMEALFRAFVGTVICAMLSYALLMFAHTDIKAFVIYEWHPMLHTWGWVDVPGFIVVAALLGPFAAFHTRACLAVQSARQRLHKRLHRWQPYAKMFDAVLYAAICAFCVALVSLCGRCDSDFVGNEMAFSFVRYNCDEEAYNPVASLLLTTAEGAVKRLFSTKNTGDIHSVNCALVFFTYTTLNIGLSGVPVPSGNFTGTMMIGGLVGRFVGSSMRRWLPDAGITEPGIYALAGSAAMLSGFKQMSVAVVLFLCASANSVAVYPVLMLCVAVARITNMLVLERGYDEEQLLRKNIPYLEPAMPCHMDKCVALDLCDPLPREAILEPATLVADVRIALEQHTVAQFPVVRDGLACIGFTTRKRLEAALRAWDKVQPRGRDLQEHGGMSGIAQDEVASRKLVSNGDVVPAAGSGSTALYDNEGELEDESLAAVTERFMKSSTERSVGDTMLPVGNLCRGSPFMVLEDMPARRLYPLFARVGEHSACVVSDKGEFRGMVSREGLIAAARRLEKGDQIMNGGCSTDSGSAEEESSNCHTAEVAEDSDIPEP